MPFSEAAAGIAGIETLLPLTVSLVNDHQLPIETAIAAVTSNPARIIGIDAGHLAVGAQADLCLFDPVRSWVFNSETMQTHGRNSPFLGARLQGKVVKTLIQGRTVYSED